MPSLLSEPAHWSEWLLLAAAVLAVLNAHDHAGSYNDGSRLATVESLVDYQTFAIDQSIFVAVPRGEVPSEQLPYDPKIYGHVEKATGDRLCIDGRFYSDKPPVPALYLAGVYRLLQWTTGLQVRERADRFCYAMTLASSTLAYVLAVWAIGRMARGLGLPLGPRLALTASFALSTVAIAYTSHVNGHILQLPVAVILFERLLALKDTPRPGIGPLLLIGSLAGLGYAIEQAAGGLLLAGVLILVLVRWPRPGNLILTGLGALPWLLLHHGSVYSFAGTLKPIGAVPEYFQYEGSEFDASSLTGRWNHPHLGEFLAYAFRLLFADYGFLSCDLPLLLLIPAAWLLRPETSQRALVGLAWGWCLSTWLVYAALSTNGSGSCCSVRWFVPLLAPAYLLLGLLLRQRPELLEDFLILNVGGVWLGYNMWWHGAWRWLPDSEVWVPLIATVTAWAAWGRAFPYTPGRRLAAWWTRRPGSGAQRLPEERNSAGTAPITMPASRPKV